MVWELQGLQGCILQWPLWISAIDTKTMLCLWQCGISAGQLGRHTALSFLSPSSTSLMSVEGLVQYTSSVCFQNRLQKQLKDVYK